MHKHHRPHDTYVLNFLEALGLSVPVDDEAIQPFHLESASNKKKRLLGWLIDSKFEWNMLNKNTHVLDDGIGASSLLKLQSSPNRSKFRRILESPIDLIDDYLSPLLKASIIELRANDFDASSIMYSCMECNLVFTNNDQAWECEGCLLWFHSKCMKRYPRDAERQHKFCKYCYI